MIGNNVLTLNQATINKAVEYYLNQCVLKDAVDVIGVRKNGGYESTFEVEVRPIEVVAATDTQGGGANHA